MASTPPTLSTVPARMPMHETESYQTGAPAQQPPVQVDRMTLNYPDFIYILHTGYTF